MGEYEYAMIAIGILLLFWGVNKSKALRYRQGIVFVMAGIFYIFFIYLYFDLHVFEKGIFKEMYAQMEQSASYQEYLSSMSQLMPMSVESARLIEGHKEKLPLMQELMVLSILGVLLFLIVKIIIIGLMLLLDLIKKPKLGIFSTFFYEKYYGKLYVKDTYVIMGIVDKYFGCLLFLMTFF